MKKGLYANIHAKRKAGKPMRKAGQKGAPTKQDFINAKKTAKKKQMAKQRLVDFRGGINEKVSPHMIGDSQGQDAEDLDFATVRLEGRKNFNSANKANGSFLYDPGDGTANARWVSIYPSDTDSYIEYASDFAVWNRDLYVAMGAKVKYDSNDNLVLVASTDHSGQTIRYLDGGTTAQTLTFNPPSAAEVTLTDPSWNTAIVPAIDEFVPPPPAGETGIVTTGTSDTTSWTYINYTEWDGLYTQYGTEEASAGGRTIYRKSGSSVNYYVGGTNSNPETTSSYQVAGLGDPFTGETSGYFYTRSNDSIVTTNNVGVTTSNRNDFGVQSDGSWDRNGIFVPSGNIHGQDSSGNDYYTWYRYGGGVSNLYGRDTSVANSPIYQGTPTTNTSTIYQPSSGGNYSSSGTAQYWWSWKTYTFTSYTVSISNYQTLNSTYNYNIQYDPNNVFHERSIAVAPDYPYNYFQPYPPDVVNGVHQTYTDSNGYTFLRFSFGTTNLASSASSNNIFYAPAGSNPDTSLTSGVFYRYSTFPSTSYFTSPMRFYDITAGEVEILWDYDPNGGASQSGFSTIIATNISYKDALTQYGSYLKTTNNIQYTYEPVGGTRQTSGGTNIAEYTDINTFQVTGAYWPIRRSYQATTYGYTSLPQLTQTKYSFPANMTYTAHQDTVPAGTTIPATDAFSYDDARAEIYQPNTASGTPTVINDESRGDNWLTDGRAFSGPDVASAYGYFLRAVRSSNNLPTLSTDDVTVTRTGTDVLSTNALHTPQRLDFTSITVPTDVTASDGQGGTVNDPPIAYRLYRKDNNGVTDLGYIRPSSLNVSGDSTFSGDYTSDISISFSTTTKKVTISNLLTSKKYRLKWWCYQHTTLTGADLIVTSPSSTTNDTSLSARSNTSGYAFTGVDTLVLQLAKITNGDTRMYAIDIWLEESFLEGPDANTLLDNTYATVKCYDLLYDTAYDQIDADHDGTPDDAAQTIEDTSDFLDLFSADLLNDGLGSTSSISAPDYCKFFKESNNFFFAVGTSFSDSTLYGGSANTNKAGSYLFVSEYNDPTTWYATGYVQFNSEITGLHTYPGELIVWTENGTFRVAGSRYDQMRKTKLATTEGMPEGNHRTAVLVNNYLVWVSSTGICFYDGRQVTNLTRGRFNDFGFLDSQKLNVDYDYQGTDVALPGTGLHAGQKDGIYYVVGSDEKGFAVDFNLQGFPITRVDLKESATTSLTTVPKLVYDARDNRLLSVRGSIADSAGNRTWSYKTRDFDGGAFGSLKLIKSVVLNGTGSGKVQIYLDGVPVFTDNSGEGKTVSVDFSDSNPDTTQPAKLYVPAAIAGSTYGLPIADVWSVEINDWDGKIDWIDTEYEMVSG